jgi:hypothetical protein
MSYFRSHPVGRANYLVEFSLGMGIEGLQTGSPIRLGGLDVGQVERLSYKEGRLMVDIGLDRTVRLYPGVQIIRVGSIVGGQAMLVITNAGETNAPPMKTGSTVQASPGTGGVENLIGTENASRLAKIQTSLRSAVKGLEAIRDQAGHVSDDADSLKELANRVETDAEIWRPKMDQIEKHFQSIRLKSTRIKDGVEPSEEHPEISGWAKLQSTFNKLIAQKEETEKAFDEDVLPKIDKIIATAEAAWDKLLENKGTFEKLASEGRTSLEVFMANSTLSSEQLALAESEILGALGLPLLEQPSAEDDQLLIRQQAMGDWTRAAFRLRTSLEALESIQIKEGDDAQATLARLVDTLHAALADYEEAQVRFFSPPKPRDSGEE